MSLRGKRTALVLAVAAAFVALVVYGSFHSLAYECEVCVLFRGVRMCRRATASSADEAQSTARVNACALLVAGMTDTITCQHTPPDSVACIATR